MAKIIVASLKTKPSARTSPGKSAGRASVTEKRVRDTEGQVKTLRTLDAGSSTFGEDLQYVFGRNVAKARRDNKRITGSTDVAIAKR